MRWGKVKLEDIVSFRGGGTPRKDILEYWESEIPWATVKDFKSLEIRDTQDKISKKGLDASSSNLIPAGHVIIPTRMALGKAAINNIDVAINQDLKALIPKGEVDTRYLLYSMLSLSERIKENGSGATVKGITQTKLSRFEIPFPPLPEQKRIATILDAAEALRARRRQTLKELDAFLQATFLHMFGDPVTNPMGWNVVEFEALGKSRLGKMLDKTKEKGNSQCAYLANFNVQWGEIIFDGIRTMDFSESERKEFKLEKGDLLICEGGEIGRTAIWRGEQINIYFQKALHRVRLKQNVSTPEYVMFYMYFMAKNGGFKDFSSSSTIAHLTGVKLKKMPVPLPPFPLQQQFAAIVEFVERQKVAMKAHLAELDDLFGSLQQRAFNGEL